MSIHTTTDVVNNNLVYLVDADNIKSYNPAENLFIHSENLLNAVYSNTYHTIVQSGFPPSGPKAGFLVTNKNSSDNFAHLYVTYTSNTLTAYTYSVYVKANTQPNTSIIIGTNGYTTTSSGGLYFRTVFNTTNKTFNLPELTKFASDPITIDKFSYGYSDVGNEWYRLYVTADLSAHANVTNISGGLYVGDYGNIIAANGTSMYVTGYMLDSTKSLNSYVKTTNAVITKQNYINSLSKLATTGTFSNNPIFNSGYLEFNGINQQITHPTIPEIQFLGNSPYTINVWFNNVFTPNTATYPGILNHESNPGSGRDGYNLYTTKAGVTPGYTKLASERQSVGVNTLVFETILDSDIIGKWNNVCVVYDGAILIMYRNGTLKSSTSSTGILTNTTATLSIGQLAGTYFGNNKIGQISMYNRALTENEIVQNYNAMKSRYGL